MEFRRRIRNNLVFLTESTSNLVVLTIHLIQNGVITRAERDTIMGRESFVSQCDVLFHILSQKLTESSFHCLLTALKESGNQHIADVLVQESDIKIKELAQKLQNLSEAEITDLNNELGRLDDKNGKKEGLFIGLQSRILEKVIYEKNQVIPKPTVRQCSSQTEYEGGVEINQIVLSNPKKYHLQNQQYIFHDTTLLKNPFEFPTNVKELILYHVKITGTELRKLFRNIRGLGVFKWLSFSQGGEFALRDFDALVESNLTDLTFKCINLEFDDEKVPNITGLLHLRLWMCKFPENLVEILTERFPNLETIDFKGVQFESGGGLRVSDIKSLLDIPSLKKIYIGPWTYPAFRNKPENDPEFIELFQSIQAPMHTWSPLIKRDSNYKWKYECENNE